MVDDDGTEQWLVYTDKDGVAELHIVRFCSGTKGCQSTVGEWTRLQICAAREASVPVVISVLAGWFLTVGLVPRRRQT